MALAASVVGSQVPLAAVTLETMGLLLEVLGEVPSETAQLLQAPLVQKLTCHSSLLRMGVGSPSLQNAMPNLIIVHLTPAAEAAHGHATAVHPTAVCILCIWGILGDTWVPAFQAIPKQCRLPVQENDALTDAAHVLLQL